MTIVSARTGAVLLSWSCLLFSLQGRSDDQRQTVTALAPERPLILPAMKTGAFSGGRAILISGGGVETVSIGSIRRQSAPKPRVATEDCPDPQDKRLLR